MRSMPRSCAALIRLSVIHAQSQTPPSCGRQLDGAAVRTGDLRAHRPVQPEKVTAALDDANGPLDRLKIAGPDRGPVYAEEQPLQTFLHEFAELVRALIQGGAALGKGLGHVLAGQFDQAAVGARRQPLAVRLDAQPQRVGDTAGVDRRIGGELRLIVSQWIPASFKSIASLRRCVIAARCARVGRLPMNVSLGPAPPSMVL
ncbi:hypothetical protein ACF087_17690 [Streptomyces goshikiensis]|uniref:hypothetical protein n=1 Tax=Streptomyces goshikiensis TaxID=1942 RepID=UPI0036FEAD54